MASKTNFLNLILAGNNEFNDNWDVPINNNFTSIDVELEVLSTLLESSRFTKASLAEFLAVSHFTDGTLRPTPELSNSRNSKVYGSNDNTGTDYDLKKRLDLGDMEVYTSREESVALLDNMARRSQDFNYADHVLAGASTIDGQPNFLSSSAAEFRLDGSPTKLEFNIDGYYMMLDQDISIPVSGVDGTKYLVAKRPLTPEVLLDRSTQTSGVSTANTLNNNKVQLLADASQDFSAQKVRAGMICRILNSTNAGDYIIDGVSPGGDVTRLQIIGNFVNAIGALNYLILDPLKPIFSVETNYSVQKGKCNIGEGSFVSNALVSSLAYNYKGKFSSIMEAVNVGTTPSFEKIFNHNLGKIPTKISIFASQANDESQPFEPLSTAIGGHSLSVLINDTVAYTPGSFNVGTTDASYVPGSLLGGVSGSLSGNIESLKSVQVKITKTQIFIKNIKANHFYRDYNDVDRADGFLKVVCEK